MMNASCDLYCLYCENDYIVVSNFYQSIKKLTFSIMESIDLMLELAGWQSAN